MSRPKLKIELTRIDKIVEIIGWLMLATTWIITIVNYTKLPKIIPTHYNAAGKADGYDDKSFLWELLLITSVLHIGLTFLNRFPHVFNYLTKITEENAERQYIIATKMIRFTKLAFDLIYGAIVLSIICDAMGWQNSIASYVPPFSFLLILAVLGNYVIASIRAK